MNIQIPCHLTRTLTTRLSPNQFDYVKSQANASEYIRALIERDLSLVVQDAKS